MSILVECPACGAKLNAPESAAGKKVRCPKTGCGSIIPVPDLLPTEEVVEAVPIPLPPPLPAPKPSPVKAAAIEDDEDDRPRKRRRDDDDDDRPRSRRRRDEDDDDEDDQPRRKRYQPRRRSGTNPGVVVAVVLGLILLVGGGGYGIYLLMGGGKAAPPKDWKEYVYKDAGFKAYFPKEPRVQNMPIGAMGAIAGGNAEGVESFSQYMAGGPGDSAQVIVMAVRYKSGSAIRDQIAKGLRESMDKAGEKMETRSVSWLGVSATEFSGPDGKGRIAVTDTALYLAAVRGTKGQRAAAADENGFFDNFVLVK